MTGISGTIYENIMRLKSAGFDPKTVLVREDIRDALMYEANIDKNIVGAGWRKDGNYQYAKFYGYPLRAIVDLEEDFVIGIGKKP